MFSTIRPIFGKKTRPEENSPSLEKSSKYIDVFFRGEGNQRGAGGVLEKKILRTITSSVVNPN